MSFYFNVNIIGLIANNIDVTKTDPTKSTERKPQLALGKTKNNLKKCV